MGGAPRPSSAQARDVLSSLDADGTRLAARVVTPWWYHLTLGVIVAVFVGSQALPGSASIGLVALGIIALPILVTVYNRRYGVSISQPTGPRSRRLLFTTVAVLVVAMLSSLVFKMIGFDPWWALIPAVLAAAATTLLGRRYDNALRSELALGRGTHS